MKFMQDLSIRGKLYLISAIPLLGLGVLLYSLISDSLADRRAAEQVYQEGERVEVLSGVVNELQAERGRYLIYLASNSQHDKRMMVSQTRLTDSALIAARNVYERQGVTTESFKPFDSLAVFRANIYTHGDNLNALKATLLDEILNIVRISRDPDIKNALEAHLSLLYIKEYFSRTKNILLPYLINKNFEGIEFARFSTHKGQFELSREQFENSASSEVLAYYRTQIEASPLAEVEANLDSLFVDPGVVQNIDLTDWWDSTAGVLDAYLQTERYSLLLIRGRADAEMAAMNRVVVLNSLMVILVIIVIALLVPFTIRQITSSIGQISSAARKLADGEVDIHIDVSSQDEVGELASSFKKMGASIKMHAETAQSIGRGDYGAEVLMRSDRDVLGKALDTMRNDLQRLSIETQLRTWLLTGNNRLNDRLRGEKELGVLADDVIGELTRFLNAQIGALYVRENGHLVLTGRYAFSSHGHEQTFSLHQGFVGQVAADGKYLVMHDVPDDYIRITSAVGESKPRHLVVYPFHYEGEIRGVIEIGSIKEFSPADLELLALISGHIGVAVNGAQSRQRLKELLEETQRQSEELETQQAELKQYNEELLEKTTLLQKSEEELKTQQEELQMTNEELSEKASILEEQKRNLEFTQHQMESKARELEQANQYKSEFLSNMSHELRTPLNSILILAQVLIENRNKTLTAKEIQFARTILNSGNDLLSLINEVLDLAKIEAGKMDLDVESFSLDALIPNLRGAFSELAKSKKIRFSVRCDPRLKGKVLVSDQQRLEQVLKNFLSNAFKFTGSDGKVELLVDVPPPGVAFRRKSLKQSDDTVAFIVSDSGIGIPEDKLEAIFEAFHQVDGSTRRKYGGTGLGLSISRELAHLLGGEIHVKSQPGAGSVFTLYIPAEISGAAADGVRDVNTLAIPSPEEVPPASDVPLIDSSHYDDQHLITPGDRIILIMEDDVEFSKVLLDFVHERNYKGIIAHQGNVGLAYARHYKPDAIILDMGLPVIDGTEVLKKLKSDPDLRHIPVQIISGHDYRRRGLELGALDFIRKPITREAFTRALDKVEHVVSRKPKKLLIVEDNKQQNEAVQELIGNGDVKCYSAFSGKEAYDMLSKTSFDCIIVDLGLPDMTGFGFLEKIREDKDLNRIPVIVYTGKDLSKEENSRLEKLASTVVLKTAFSNERLLDETTLFLHRVESKLPKEKQSIIRKLHKTDQVLKGKRVLVVDDDERNAYSLVNALAPEGMEVFRAENGLAALDILNSEKNIDIILMDVMMPQMDGFEATRRIRQMPEFRRTPIIALTAKAMKDDREKCLAAGMSDYISKPLNLQQLVALMRVWLYA